MVIGDSGAGKSETLEALRIIGDEELEEIINVADDMGSIKIDKENGILVMEPRSGLLYAWMICSPVLPLDK